MEESKSKKRRLFFKKCENKWVGITSELLIRFNKMQVVVRKLNVTQHSWHYGRLL